MHPSPFMAVSVSNAVFYHLHDMFDRGHKFAFSGKDDGTNRKLQRGADGVIFDVDSGAIVASRSFLLNSGADPNCRTKSDQYVLRLDDDWERIQSCRADVIVLVCCGRSARESVAEVARHLLRRPGFLQLPAMRANPPQLYVLDHDVLSRPGSALIGTRG